MVGGTNGRGGGGLIVKFPLFFPPPPSGGNLNALFIVPVLPRFFSDGVVGSSSSASPSTDGKDGSGMGIGLFEVVELRAGTVGDAELGTDSSPVS